MEFLDDIFNSVWQQLIRAKNDKKHPFRFGTFGTVSNDIANMRTVVIRKVIKETNELWLYTDFRTPKVKEIQINPKVSWHFYHPKQQIQIRLYGTAEIFHNQMINQEIWQNLPEYGKSEYLTQNAPGTTKITKDIAILGTDNSANFCIIKTTIHQIDWLKLSREEHQRVGFRFINNEWIGEELIP